MSYRNTRAVAEEWQSCAVPLVWVEFTADVIEHRVREVTSGERFAVTLLTTGHLERLDEHDWMNLESFGFPVYLYSERDSCGHQKPTSLAKWHSSKTWATVHHKDGMLTKIPEGQRVRLSKCKSSRQGLLRNWWTIPSPLWSKPSWDLKIAHGVKDLSGMFKQLGFIALLHDVDGDEHADAPVSDVAPYMGPTKFQGGYFATVARAVAATADGLPKVIVSYAGQTLTSDQGKDPEPWKNDTLKSLMRLSRLGVQSTPMI